MHLNVFRTYLKELEVNEVPDNAPITPLIELLVKGIHKFNGCEEDVNWKFVCHMVQALSSVMAQVLSKGKSGETQEMLEPKPLASLLSCACTAFKSSMVACLQKRLTEQQFVGVYASLLVTTFSVAFDRETKVDAPMFESLHTLVESVKAHTKILLPVLAVIRVPRHEAPQPSLRLRIHLLAACAGAMYHNLQQSDGAASTKEAQKLRDVLTMAAAVVSKAVSLSTESNGSHTIEPYLKDICQLPPLQQQFKTLLHGNLHCGTMQFDLPASVGLLSCVYRSTAESDAVRVWSDVLAHLSRGTDANSLSNELQQRLRSNLLVLDPDAKTVFEGSSSAKRAVKPKESTEGAKDLDSVVVVTSALRLWVTLVQVTAVPAASHAKHGRTSQEQAGASDRTEDRDGADDAVPQQLAGYLDASIRQLCVLENTVKQCSAGTHSCDTGIQQDATAQLYCISEALCSTGRPLATCLYLAGRLKDQAVVLNVVSTLCQALSAETASELHALREDLLNFRLVTLALCATPTKLDSANAAGGSGGSLGAVTRFVVISLALLQSDDHTVKQGMLDKLQPPSGDKLTLPDSVGEFVALAKSAYQVCAVHDKRSGSGAGLCSVGVGDCMLAWVCVVATKVLMLVYCDVELALTWSGYATSAASKGNTSRPVSARESITALMEAVLQRAELYEHSGNLDGCLVYLREAASLAQRLHSPAMRRVVALHTLRVWQRSASPKLHNAVEELLGGAESEQIYSSPWQLQDEISKGARLAATALDALFCLRPESDHTAQLPNVQALSFRHQSRHWDVTPATADPNDARRVAVYHTFLPSALRTELAAQAAVCSSSLEVILSGRLRPSLSATTEPQSSSQVLLERVTATGAFDAIRDARRRMALAHLTEPSPVAPTLTTFLAGVASCGVAAESLGEADTSKRSSTASGDTEAQGSGGDVASTDAAQPSVASLAGASQCITQALLGSAAHASFTGDKLQGMLAHCDALSSSGGDGGRRRPSSAVCFMTMDSASDTLLLGRMDTSGVPLIAALPMQDRLHQLLTRWDDLQDRNQAMLRQGLDPAQITQLSDEQKRAWWSARQQYDSEIETILSDLQELLGPWRVLLSASTATAPVSVPQVQGVLEPLCKSAQAAGATKKKAASAPLPDFGHIAQWLTLMRGHYAPTAAAAARTMQLSKAEITDAVTALLQNVMPGINVAALTAAVEALVTLLSSDNVSSRISAASSKDSTASPRSESTPHMSEAELNSLKVTELRTLLKEAGLDAVGKKQDLVDRLFGHYSQMSESKEAQLLTPTAVAIDTEDTTSASECRGHVVLVLDEQVQRLPVECMPALRSASCSRVPSFAVLLTLIDAALRPSAQIPSSADAVDHLAEQVKSINVGADSAKAVPVRKGAKSRTAVVAAPDGSAEAGDNKENATTARLGSHKRGDTMSVADMGGGGDGWRTVCAEKGWYALDIEGNLPATRDTLQPFLSAYKEHWDWKGVVATVPAEDVTRHLHESSELFVFCGHGAGERMHDTFRLRKFASCPASLLWGCSSGRLKARGVHDALGTALYYLIAGAPFLVANLWDVTDKDIDKLCMAHMGRIFPAVEGAPPVSPVSSDQETKKGPKSTRGESSSSSSRSRSKSTSHGSSSADRTGESSNHPPVHAAQALAQCRDVCRMPFAVGAAPVVYGIPALVTERRAPVADVSAVERVL